MSKKKFQALWIFSKSCCILWVLVTKAPRRDSWEYQPSFFLKCISQTGLELMILPPLPPSVNSTSMHYHNWCISPFLSSIMRQQQMSEIAAGKCGAQPETPIIKHQCRIFRVRKNWRSPLAGTWYLENLEVTLVSLVVKGKEAKIGILAL